MFGLSVMMLAPNQDVAFKTFEFGARWRAAAAGQRPIARGVSSRGGFAHLMSISKAAPASVAGMLAYGLLLAARDSQLPPAKARAATPPPPPSVDAQPAARRRASSDAHVVVQLCNN